MDLRFGDAAKNEMITAAEFYDQQYQGLGDAVLDEVNQFVSLLIENPLMGRLVRIDRRSVILRRFPYRLIYTLDDIGIRIVAVAHQRQRPGCWAGRVEDERPCYQVLPRAA